MSDIPSTWQAVEQTLQQTESDMVEIVRRFDVFYAEYCKVALSPIPPLDTKQSVLDFVATQRSNDYQTLFYRALGRPNVLAELKQTTEGWVFMRTLIPVVVSNIQPWSGWTAIDRCKLCNQGHFSLTFEFSYWTYGEKHYVSEGCPECTKKLVMQDREFSSPEFWKTRQEGYRRFINDYGILDPLPGLVHQ